MERKPHYKLTEEIAVQLVKDYNDGVPMNKLISHYHKKRETIDKIMVKRGQIIRPKSIRSMIDGLDQDELEQKVLSLKSIYPKIGSKQITKMVNELSGRTVNYSRYKVNQILENNSLIKKKKVQAIPNIVCHKCQQYPEDQADLSDHPSEESQTNYD